ncbi:MAG TPA: gephyrin-like molybdotransferase Glp [Candidatus Competibacteraceae bacterium]|nr:gephyrin-like molybdotransferase Glp [Candidatus Competibacteraceae bacterium]
MSQESLKIQPSCADDYDPESLPVAEALRRIEAVVTPLAGRERVAIRAALGRVLAEPVVSPVNVPAHTNSAMDGYAVAAVDLPESGVRELTVIGTALAGQPFSGTLTPGTAVRIMTGAVVPRGADAVVMQEHTEQLGSIVRIGPGHRRGQNIRQAGEDLRAGQVVLGPGRWLTPADLGLLASLGVPEVWVRRRPRVAFFSTGDELRSIGEPLGEGEIYDSNRYTLYGMLSRLGVELIDMGVVGDDRAALSRAFREAAEHADALITSGGVSVGEADYTKEILLALGEVNFWKIAMKPGRPLAFGRIGEALFFGLPGNPVSVMVTFYQFVQPALRRLMGDSTAVEPQPRFRVPCTGRLKKRPGRTEFQRGILEWQGDGTLVVHGTGDQGSGILHTMSRANCFIILPDECGNVEPGTLVEVQPFTGLI